jgi:hypothetical protein
MRGEPKLQGCFYNIITHIVYPVGPGSPYITIAACWIAQIFVSFLFSAYFNDKQTKINDPNTGVIRFLQKYTFWAV